VTRPLLSTFLAHIDGDASREVALQAYREAEEKHGIRIYDDHDARVAPGANPTCRSPKNGCAP
jgi:hypothetical protein